MKIKKKQPLRFSSDNPAVFVSQVIIFFTIVFTLSYGLYVFIFDSSPIINADSLGVEQGVDASEILKDDLGVKDINESTFVEGEAPDVEVQKLNSLFPEIKN